MNTKSYFSLKGMYNICNYQIIKLAINLLGVKMVIIIRNCFILEKTGIMSILYIYIKIVKHKNRT